MLSKVFGGAAVLGALAALFFYGQAQTYKARWTSAQAETESLKVVVGDLKGINETTNKTLNTTLGLVAQNQEKMIEYTDRIASAEAETNRVLRDLDRMAATENQRALAAPFERGNAARARITDSLCRIWNRPDDPRCRGAEDNSDAGGGDGQ
jgi:hypothetical protein